MRCLVLVRRPAPPRSTRWRRLLQTCGGSARAPARLSAPADELQASPGPAGGRVRSPGGPRLAAAAGGREGGAAVGRRRARGEPRRMERLQPPARGGWRAQGHHLGAPGRQAVGNPPLGSRRRGGEGERQLGGSQLRGPWLCCRRCSGLIPDGWTSPLALKGLAFDREVTREAHPARATKLASCPPHPLKDPPPLRTAFLLQPSAPATS